MTGFPNAGVRLSAYASPAGPGIQGTGEVRPGTSQPSRDHVSAVARRWCQPLAGARDGGSRALPPTQEVPGAAQEGPDGLDRAAHVASPVGRVDRVAKRTKVRDPIRFPAAGRGEPPARDDGSPDGDGEYDVGVVGAGAVDGIGGRDGADLVFALVDCPVVVGSGAR